MAMLRQFLGFGLEPLRFERDLHKNRVLALRARRHQCDGATDELFDAPDILDGLGGKSSPGARSGTRLPPARDRLINRLDTHLGALAGRKIVDFPAIMAV